MPEPTGGQASGVVFASPIDDASRRWSIYGYIGFLFFVIPFTGITATTVSFLLKNQLHLPADTVAEFGFIGAVPAYFGFLFGILRDRWAPFGRRDQGILIAFSLAITAVLFVLAGVKLTFTVLLTAALVKSVCGQMLGAAEQGLVSTLGKEHAMSGRMATLWQTMAYLPGFFVSIIAGYLADHFSPRSTFLLTGSLGLAIFAFCLWRPRFIYDDPAEAEPMHPGRLGRGAMRLIRAPGIIPCICLLFLWNFTPGVGTPMLYYLTDTLHGTGTQFGAFNAYFNAFFVPTFLLHGFLCTRMNLRPLLWISTCIAVPQILPLLFVHSASSAVWSAVPMGLMGGFATAAYFDLLIRSCPNGLQGTAMMLGSSVWVLSAKLGDLAGAKIYALGGFPPCAYATVLVYACLLPVLLFVPRSVTASRDGEIAAT